MTTPYSPYTWANDAGGGTPITATRLNALEQGLAAASTADLTPVTTGEATMPRYGVSTSGTSLSASGSLCLTYFTARRTETVTQVWTHTGNTAAAATPTLCRIGVYTVDGTGAGTLVASTANDTTLFAAAFGAYTRSFSASFSKTAGQLYAVGILVVTAAAIPTFYSSQMASAMAGIAPRLAGRVASQADLPASFTGASVLSHNPIYSELRP